jgi:hypothetical protein
MGTFSLRVEAQLHWIEHERKGEGLVGRLSRALERLGAQHRATKRASTFKSELLDMVAPDLRDPR